MRAPLLFVACLLVGAACLPLTSSSTSTTSSATSYCAKGAFGCDCANAAFPLGSDEPSTSCSADTVGRPMQCCYNLFSDGTTTSCACASYACWRADDGSCSCEWVDRNAIGDHSGASVDPAALVDACTPASGQTCCAIAGSSADLSTDSCACSTRTTCPTGSTKVASCDGDPPGPLTCPHGIGQGGNDARAHGGATSCDRLTWSAPANGGGTR